MLCWIGCAASGCSCRARLRRAAAWDAAPLVRGGSPALGAAALGRTGHVLVWCSAPVPAQGGPPLLRNAGARRREQNVPAGHRALLVPVRGRPPVSGHTGPQHRHSVRPDGQVLWCPRLPAEHDAVRAPGVPFVTTCSDPNTGAADTEQSRTRVPLCRHAPVPRCHAQCVRWHSRRRQLPAGQRPVPLRLRRWRRSRPTVPAQGVGHMFASLWAGRDGGLP